MAGRIEQKLKSIAAAILQVDGGRGPDILALQEIENAGVLDRLRREYLAAANYRPPVLIEGEDLRGIDVAEKRTDPFVHVGNFGRGMQTTDLRDAFV